GASAASGPGCSGSGSPRPGGRAALSWVPQNPGGGSMKGKPEIIDALNEILTGELTAVNQYFVHARMCENWGYEKLWKHIREESIDEMKHADILIERVLYLEGVPNVQRLGKINIGQTVPEQLRLDLEVEKQAVPRLNNAIELCRSLGDN